MSAPLQETPTFLRRLPPWLAAATLAIVYFVAARTFLSLASINPSASPVWPATGLALAFLVLGGLRLWPGVFVGAVAANLLNGSPAPIAFLIGAGNALEALAGAWLVGRFANGARAFRSTRHAALYFLLVFAVATPISATVGVGALLAGGGLSLASAGRVWLNWWLGDAAGAILVAPTLMLLTEAGRHPAIRRRLPEVAAVIALVLLAGVGSYFQPPAGQQPDVTTRLGQLALTAQYVALPALIWAAVRFGPRGVGFSMLWFSGVGIATAVAGNGSLSIYSPEDRLVFLDISLCAFGLLMHLLGGIVWERWDNAASLERRVTERTSALADAEARFRLLSDSAFEAVIIHRQAVILEANAATGRLLGLEVAGLKGRNLMDFIAPESREQVLAVMRAGGEDPYSIVAVRADGTRLDVESVARTIPYGDGQARVVAVRDVTEARRSERALTSTISLLNSTLEATRDGLCVVDLDGKMTHHNAAFSAMWGLTKEEASRTAPYIREKVKALVRDPESFAAVGAGAYATPEKETVDVVEFLDGRVVERSSRPQRLGGKVIGRVWTFHDVTERRRAEEATRKASAEYQALAENSPDLISRFDRNRKRLYANRTVEATTGKVKAELAGGRAAEGSQTKPDPTTLARFLAGMDKAFAEGVPVVLDAEASGPDGAHSYETRIVPEKDADGHVATVLVLSRDTSAQVQAKRALEESQKRLEEAVAIARLGSWDWDIPSNKVSWNPQLCAIFGVDPQDAPATYEGYLAFIHPDDRAAIDARIRQSYADGSSYVIDHRVLRPDGTIRHIHSDGRVFRDAAGAIVRMAGTAQDITERAAQERKFRGLLSAAPDGIVIADQAGKIVLVNAQAEKLFGYPPEEMVGQPIETLVPDAVRGRHEGHRAKYTGDAHVRPMGAGLDLRARRKDGSEFPVEISLSPLETPEGTLVISSVRDVTDRKQAQAALRASHDRFQALADASPIGIAHTTPQGSVDYANKTWTEITGIVDFRDDDLVRRSIHPEDQPRSWKLWGEAFQSGKPFADEMRWIHPDGSVRTTSCRAVPTKAPDGSITGFVSTVEDVTQRHAAEQDLRSAKDAAEKAAQAKSEFLANMSHEIRTPLNAVLGMAQLLMEADLEARQKGLVQVIHTSGEHLLTVINDILDLSKSESGRLELAREPVEPLEVARDVLRIVGPHAAERGIALGLEPVGAPPPFVGDPGRLRQVLLNLASNAVKFTDHGAVEIRIAGKTMARGEVETVFEVRDTGIGIPPDRLGHLFQPFSQLDGSSTRAHGGTGLGLAISQRLVRLMGGQITVESTVGQGSTFRFTLRSALAAPRLPTAAPRPAANGPLRILLAEDNPVNRKVALAMMERLGYQADVAVNGQEAVEASKARAYDVILMDVQMPVLDGLEATRRIHAQAPEKHPFIVAMTAGALPGDKEKCLAAGMDYYIAKPIRLEALAEVLGGRGAA